MLDYYTSTTGIIEIVATCFLIINVYLIAKEKLINYWFGLIGVLLMGYVVFEFKLYSDAALQWLFYAPLQIVGWYMWKYTNRSTQELDSMSIVRLQEGQIVLLVIIISAASYGLGTVMNIGTDADLPFIDATTTVMSIVASILLLRKVWENWVIWITVDLISIPVYWYKELYVVSGLYVIFLGLATYGCVTWYNKMKEPVYV